MADEGCLGAQGMGLKLMPPESLVLWLPRKNNTTNSDANIIGLWA
jgi:hypothetical protein